MSSFIDRYSAKQFGLKKNEIKPEILKKLTHLYLNGKHIEEIGDLSLCVNLKVLYLHNNSIREISNCNGLMNLTHLYLQWNKICQIQNINNLRNLRKLYLGHNELYRLENIDGLSRLEELHIERQRNSAAGDSLEFSFEASSIRGIADSLKVLNVSGLELTRLDALLPLKRLQELNASRNRFADADGLALLVKSMPHLTEATFRGCPAQRSDRHYRDKIIAASDVLDCLDDKQISNNARHFLQRLEQVKAEKTARGLSTQNTQATEDELVDELTEIFEKRFLDHMESNFSVGSVSYDELSFKAWQSLKLRDSRNSTKFTKNIKHVLDKNLSTD